MKIFRNIITELKNTTWPTWKEILNMTLYTLAIAILIALIMTGLDLILAALRDWFLKI